MYAFINEMIKKDRIFSVGGDGVNIAARTPLICFPRLRGVRLSLYAHSLDITDVHNQIHWIV